MGDNAPIHLVSGESCGPMVAEDHDGGVLPRLRLRCISCGSTVRVNAATWDQARAADLAYDAEVDREKTEPKPEPYDDGAEQLSLLARDELAYERGLEARADAAAEDGDRGDEPHGEGAGYGCD
jgi:hypothetical protein